MGDLGRAMAAMAAMALVSACDGDAAAPPPEVPSFIAAEITHDAEGRCWGRDVAPAVVQTVTVQELVIPAVIGPDGTEITPAVYNSSQRQEILRERGPQDFETICPPVYTAEFVSSLQRALTARGYYSGPVNGVIDTATGRAVQDYQRGEGPDSPLLSIAAARRLGLIALTRDQIDLL